MYDPEENKTWWRIMEKDINEDQSETFYIDQIYYKILELDINGFSVIGDDAVFENPWPKTHTYTLDTHEQLLGFESYFTTIKKDVEGSGVATENLANVIGWLGLVVLDTNCA